MPVVALIASGTVILAIRKLILHQPHKRRLRLGFVMITLILVSAVLFAFFFLSLIGGGALEELLKRGRPGSYVLRSRIYQVTMDSWRERPIVGWGTQRRLPELPPDKAPGGTHSEYMAYLYRYGLIGLLLHLGVYAGVWLALIPCWLSKSTTQDKDDFLITCVIGLFAFHLNGVVHGLDWDVTIPLVLWTMVGLSYFFCTTHRDVGADAAAPSGAQA
jgi:O-antigen ligase